MILSIYLRLLSSVILGEKLVDWLCDQMRSHDFTVSSIHGDIPQDDRDTILQEFRSGSCRVLLTTSQLSRGLDIQQVDIIINYDFPRNPIEYYHRMGRAGRFGRKATCISLLLPSDSEQVMEVEDYFGISISILEKNTL